MNDSTVMIFGWLALALLISNVTVSLNIVKKLHGYGEKADLRWLRFKAFGYAKRYKEITLKETGQPGSLYYGFVITAGLFALCLAVGIMIASKVH